MSVTILVLKNYIMQSLFPLTVVSLAPNHSSILFFHISNTVQRPFHECCLVALSYSCMCSISPKWNPFLKRFRSENIKCHKMQDLVNRMDVLMSWFAFGPKIASLIILIEEHCCDEEPLCGATGPVLYITLFLLNAPGHLCESNGWLSAPLEDIHGEQHLKCRET
jgi:hypothetical protein